MSALGRLGNFVWAAALFMAAAVWSWDIWRMAHGEQLSAFTIYTALVISALSMLGPAAEHTIKAIKP